MDDKKISFSFNKSNKKTQLILKKESAPASNKEFIKCLESHEIKLIEEKPAEAPLVIPLKESHKTSRALASLMKRRAVLLGEEDMKCEVNGQIDDQVQCQKDKKDTESETLEERAAREILNATKQSNGEQTTSSNLILPIVHPDKLPLDGAQESTLDDYERIPVIEFGKAMLRGMGWVDPPPSTDKPDDVPQIRPKGMGLGADKMLKPKPLLIAPEPNEVLQIKRNAYVRIIGGKYKDLYGQIEGFDDYAGRIIVKMAIGNNKETFNEFLCQPVTFKEYTQYGKCINNVKYEEYKRKEKEENKKPHKHYYEIKKENCNTRGKQECDKEITKQSYFNDTTHLLKVIKSEQKQIDRKQHDENNTSAKLNKLYRNNSPDGHYYFRQSNLDCKRQQHKTSSFAKSKKYTKEVKAKSDSEDLTLRFNDVESEHHKHHHHGKHKKRKSKKSSKQRDRSRSSRRN